MYVKLFIRITLDKTALSIEIFLNLKSFARDNFHTYLECTHIYIYRIGQIYQQGTISKRRHIQEREREREQRRDIDKSN